MPFKKVSIETDTKAADIVSMTQAVINFNPDVVVLARYMQIIPEDLCNPFARVIFSIS